MLFSPSSRYAIRSLSYLAGTPARRPIQVTTIAEAAGVPAKFLAKIMGTLKSHGYVTAIKGPGGGYFLEADPAALTVFDIVTAIDGPKQEIRECVLGLDTCSDAVPCPLHFEWQGFRNQVEDHIHQVSIHELAEKLHQKRAHLKTPSLE